jgi:SAM-dependent methyltransferase
MGNDFVSNLASQARSRWRGDGPDAELTWGSIMTGDSFFDEVEKHFPFTSYTRILEIGPGYGRLLKTLLDRGHPFASFCGVDLSEARVDKLRRQFSDDRIRFEIGDCSQYKLSQSFDIGLCSATFEHLYPSIEQTLVNLRSQIDLNGLLFVDFIMHDENLSLSQAYFEDESIGGAYIRIYSLPELERLFDQADFTIQTARPLVLGTGFQGETIRRMLICARARHSRHVPKR